MFKNAIAVCVVAALLLSVGLPAAAHTCGHDSTAIQAITEEDLQRDAARRRRQTSSGPAINTSDVPRSLRVAVSALDTNTSGRFCTAAGDVVPDLLGRTVTCAEADVLTDAARAYLLDVVLPAAIRRVSNALLVHRRLQPVPLADGVCQGFTLPDTRSVNDTDFVLLVAAAPIASTGGSDAVQVAWASPCAQDSAERPIVGRINFNPRALLPSTAAAGLELQHVAAHELFHALGFTSSIIVGRGFMRSAPLRGKSSRVEFTGALATGAHANFTGCTNGTLRGVELEDEGGLSAAFSHFKRRQMLDDLMAAVPGTRVSLELLLAMQDLGVGYTANVSAAEERHWGRDAGCGLHTARCDTAAGGRGSLFCFSENYTDVSCTATRVGYGPCAVGTAGADLPEHARYFAGATRKGGVMPFMDFCPIVWHTPDALCTTESASGRCLVRADTGAPRCVDVACNAAGTPLVAGRDCPSGANVSMDAALVLKCPADAASICATLPSADAVRVLHASPAFTPRTTPSVSADPSPTPPPALLAAARGASLTALFIVTTMAAVAVVS